MSQTNPNLEKYRGTSGSEVKTANVSSDDNPLKKAMGGEAATKERIYDPTLAGERFVQFYDDTAAALREYLSNSETACIRRAEAELREAGFSDDEIPNEVTDMLEMAKEECGYEPLIEVTYNRKADETRLVIEDNGIGISTEEYQVVQRVGYSTSHDEGSRLGNFGMGWMSGFQLTSVNGVFKMKTRSFQTDEAYGTAEYVANFEFLDANPTEYGTTFEFPSFGEEAKKINISSKVREFTDGMIITVLYREFDESGQETHLSDDFLPTRMEDDYPDDATVVIYEDEFFKAVMSPENAHNRRGILTYNISMPIRRNEDAYGTNNKWEAPWQWDYRGKREDGPIVACESDESVVGLIPKEDSKYENLMDGLQKKCIRMSEVPDDAIVMPDPASSRDSFKSGHDDFWKYVGDKMNEKWAEVAKEHFTGLDSWDTFMTRDRADKKALFRAYSHYGPKYGKSDPETIQETLDDTFGVTVPTEVCENLDKSRKTLNVVRQSSTQPQRKRATREKKIWEIIHEAPDGVYVAKSPSKKKCNIAWGLGDTHVVRVDNYGIETYWDWELLKDLPSFNLAEKLPDLDQSVIDKYDGSRGGGSGSSTASRSSGGNGRDPTTYTAKVRYTSGKKNCYYTHNAKNLKESLEADDEFKIGTYKKGKYLVIRNDDESAREVARHANYKKDVGAVALPKYAYDYLKGTNNVYTSLDEVVKDKGGATIDLDGTDMELRHIPEHYCLVYAPDRWQTEWTAQELVELDGRDKDKFKEYLYINPDDFHDSWGISTPATVYKYLGKHRLFDDFTDYINRHVDFDDLYKKDALQGIDLNDDEHEALFGYSHGRPSGKELRTLCDIAARIDSDD